MPDIFEWVLRTAPAPASADDSLHRFWERHAASLARWTGPFDAAVIGGFQADRLGFAFAAGYRAAVQSAVPELPVASVVSFCATEHGGAHPRLIRATLTRTAQGWLLEGQKSWATMAPLASELLIVASSGVDPKGLNQLHLIRLNAHAQGVTIRAMPQLPFAPEVPHAEVLLDGVEVEPGAVLPGDGYRRYVRPFRTLEDVHVQAALLGYWLRLARMAAWPERATERVLAAGLALRAASQMPAHSATLHLALAGIQDELGWLLDQNALWSSIPEVERQRWNRDLPLLQVASRARESRRLKAWSDTRATW